MVVRPESVRIGTGELAARVGRSTFLGPLVEYELLVGDDVLLAVDPDWMGQGLHQPGDEIAWSVRPEQAYALPPAAPTRRLRSTPRLPRPSEQRAPAPRDAARL